MAFEFSDGGREQISREAVAFRGRGTVILGAGKIMARESSQTAGYSFQGDHGIILQILLRDHHAND